MRARRWRDRSEVGDDPKWNAPLTGALSESGLRADAVEPAAFLVVDVVHGSALSGVVAERADEVRTWFEQGLEIVLAGIEVTAGR